jgi:hypothetical protein
MKKSIRFANIPSELSWLQLGVSIFAALFLLMTIIQDIFLSASSSMLQRANKWVYLVAILIIFVGTALPALLWFWLYPQISRLRKGSEKPWPVPLTTAAKVFGYLGILLIILFLMAVCAFFEMFFPLSVLPFTTAVCGIVWALAGNRILRCMKIGRRLTVVATILCLILGVRYADWNSRRPFIRDLLRIRTGMTVADVEAIMSGYMKGTGLSWPPIWDDKPKGFNSVSPATSGAVIKGENGEMKLAGSLVYRHSTDGAYNADWGVVGFENEKVITVEFLPD